MKIGIILTGYNMQEYVNTCLQAWIKARREKLGGHEFFICAVSVPFAGFPNDSQDSTVAMLDDAVLTGDIDHLIDSPANVPETTARGMALTWLKQKDIDISWQVDLDEFYTIEEITKIIKFVEDNPLFTYFCLSLKNYVFDDKTYLKEPFTPARIHRIKTYDLEASCFTEDNQIGYTSLGGFLLKWHNSPLCGMTIPINLAWIRHITWQNNERSRKKIIYQLEGRKWPWCSFAWDADKGLVFNQAYYNYLGKALPKVVTETT